MLDVRRRKSGKKIQKVEPYILLFLDGEKVGEEAQTIDACTSSFVLAVAVPAVAAAAAAAATAPVQAMEKQAGTLVVPKQAEVLPVVLTALKTTVLSL